MDEQFQISFDFLEPLPGHNENKKETAPKRIPLKKTMPVVEKPKSNRGRKSIKSYDDRIEPLNLPDDDILFKRAYYPIGEVAEMFKLTGSLIRYWENEFDILKPKKDGKGTRYFRPEDVKNLKLIYHLLRERKYTIDGAKDFLKKNKKGTEKFEMILALKKVKAFLLELKSTL